MKITPLTAQLFQHEVVLPSSSEENLQTITDLTLLHQKLTSIILDLLTSNFERLLQILYRIDVSQPKVEQALQAVTHQEIAMQLADLVLEREVEKIAWRMKYNTNHKNSST